MTNAIKCGVAGVGYLGKHHARIYDSLDGCELVGVLPIALEVHSMVIIRRDDRHSARFYRY